MNEHRSQTIEQRLNHLEEQNRALRRRNQLALGGLGLVAWVPLALAAVPSRNQDFDSITVKRFVFHDKAGKTRIEMKLSAENEVTQTFWDSSGEVQMRLPMPVATPVGPGASAVTPAKRRLPAPRVSAAPAPAATFSPPVPDE